MDWKEEYAPTAATPPTSPGPERVALNGQTTDAATGRALGTPDPLVTVYGSARVDYYAANRSIVTLEGGAAQEENPVFTIGSGRNQARDRKSTRLNSSHLVISYAVFCLKKKKKN